MLIAEKVDDIDVCKLVKCMHSWGFLAARNSMDAIIRYPVMQA